VLPPTSAYLRITTLNKRERSKLQKSSDRNLLSMDFYVPFFHYPDIREFSDVRTWRVIDPDQSIRTGDILLFSASGLVSSIIKLFTISKWCHIGMACWCEMEHNDGRKTVDIFSFELGSQPYTDLMSRKLADKEVRLVRFADIAGMYDMVAVRRLNSTRKSAGEKRHWSEKFQAFMHQWKKTPFFDISVLIKNNLLTCGAPDNQTTCSQIAGKMLEHMGVFKLNFDPSQLCPDDFGGHSKAFPEQVFRGKEMVIYRHDRLINARLFFIFIVLMVILIIIVILLRKNLQKSFWSKRSGA
jgi:hypothetical protein